MLSRSKPQGFAFFVVVVFFFWRRGWSILRDNLAASRKTEITVCSLQKSTVSFLSVRGASRGSDHASRLVLVFLVASVFCKHKAIQNLNRQLHV